MDTCRFSLWPLTSSPPSFPFFHHEMPKEESSTSSWVTSNLHISLSLSVSLPLLSIHLNSSLNQEMVALATPGACQRITLPVCVPVLGLWLSAWCWLWSWLSMPYRSARGEKRGHPPRSRSQKQKVLFTRLILRRLNHCDMDEIFERRKRKQRNGKNADNLHLWICCLFDVLLGQTMTVTQRLKKQTNKQKQNAGLDRSMKADVWKWLEPRGPKLIVSDWVLSIREGMNNIIKRGQDWHFSGEKGNEWKVNRAERERFLLSVTFIVLNWFLT